MATQRFVVTGVVQGVGFRWFVSREASRLGISGRVWNCTDGDVEIIAHHADEARLAAFLQALWTGPGMVKSIRAEEARHVGDAGFRIVAEPAREA